jgi:hypothetical protein
VEGEEVRIGGSERSEVCGEGQGCWRSWWWRGRLSGNFLDVVVFFAEVGGERGINEVGEDVFVDHDVDFVDAGFEDVVADFDHGELVGHGLKE